MAGSATKHTARAGASYDATKRPYSGTGRLTAPKQQRINHLAYEEDLADTENYEQESEVAVEECEDELAFHDSVNFLD